MATAPALAKCTAATTVPSPTKPDPSRVRFFLEILSTTPLPTLDTTLSSLPIKPSQSEIESILQHSYAHPSSAQKFFVWSGQSTKHSHFSYNLIVDILGKNQLFEPMWDAIRSMKHECLLSTATFASAFGSYCSANRIKDAIMTFNVMDRYGIAQDIVAVNSLLSAICKQQGRTVDAFDFFDGIKMKAAPDADTFAILLEGWEEEGDVQRAKTTFGEMVVRVGWNRDNMSAYDAFLTTLVRGGEPGEAINFLKVMKGKGCLPGIKFFAKALDVLVKDKDAVHGLALWDLMVTDSGLVPNLIMYNAIIEMVCNGKDFDAAYRLLDAMPFHGVFPNSLTYNTIFECLVQNRKKREAERFFVEMRNNEIIPSPSNCVAAVKLFFGEFDPMAAIQVWKYMVEGEEEKKIPDDECANELLIGLANLKRWSEVKNYADDMIDMGVHLRFSTLDQLKVAFEHSHKYDYYDHIARRVERRLKR